jgi:hypothetical protein
MKSGFQGLTGAGKGGIFFDRKNINVIGKAFCPGWEIRRRQAVQNYTIYTTLTLMLRYRRDDQ